MVMAWIFVSIATVIFLPIGAPDVVATLRLV